jgi:hypothetical protein
MSEALEDYMERGGPLTIERVEHVINSFAILPPPQNIVVLDGVIDVGKRIAIGAYPMLANYIILTPLSNEKTVLHEWIHYGLGLGEAVAYPLSERLYERYRRGLTIPRLRPVKYKQASEYSPQQLLSMLGLDTSYITIPPEIKHYRLISAPITRLQRI